MIGKLQRRLSLLVSGALLLVSACIVLSLYLSNLASLKAQMYRSLETLMGIQTQTTPEDPPPAPESGGGRDPGQPGDVSLAHLTNHYLVRIDDDGGVKSWSSGRSDLYTDEQVAQLVQRALKSGDSRGCIGSQFYLLSDSEGGRLMVVIDARRDLESARRSLASIVRVTAAAWAVLTAGALLLIRRMLRPVQDAFERQKQFVWDASHELKTPLAVISANAEALSAEIGENESLSYIQSEIRRTDRLVQNLLTLARMDGGRMQPTLRSFDLSRALTGVTLPFESAVFEAGRTLKTHIDEGVECTGDEEMLKQLAVILLGNALKYSNDGGEIDVRLSRRDGRPVLEVQNTGTPIPPESLPRIFDRFYRVDDSHNRENPGNGLGLSIARSIVQAHRGEIAVQSDAQHGTTFRVTLPK